MMEPVKVELMCFVVLQESIRTVFHFVLKILQQKSKFVERNSFVFFPLKVSPDFQKPEWKQFVVVVLLK